MKTLHEAKLLIVFIHTKLMNTDVDYKDVIMAVPHWQAKYSKVFTSLSEDYAVYTPIAFDVF